MTNAFTQFYGLFHSSTMDVVTITAQLGNGTSAAVTLGGAPIIIKGESVTVGQKAFVRNGEIIRQAPDLTPVQVSV